MTGRPTIRTRILAVLVTARSTKKWLDRKRLLEIASRGYLDTLLKRLLSEGLIKRRGPRGRYRYQATEEAVKELSKLGPLPRSPLEWRPPEERPRGHLVKLRPVTEFLAIDDAWMEHKRVSFQVDRHTARLIRSKCAPPARKDRARQRTFSCSAFTLTISRRGVCSLILKEPEWMKRIAEWFLLCGLSKAGTNSTISQIHSQLPDGLSRYEIPVLDRSVKKDDVQFVIATEVGEDKIVSNINWSTNIDWEIYGRSWLVDLFLSVLAGTQHNTVVTISAMEQKIAELVKEVEALRKERETKEKGGPDYIA